MCSTLGLGPYFDKRGRVGNLSAGRAPQSLGYDPMEQRDNDKSILAVPERFCPI